MRKPPWIRVQANFTSEYRYIKRMTGEMGIHTVCEEAGCPNIFECYSQKTATFLILGDKCTRNCTFCLINKTTPESVDSKEPEKVAKAVESLKLNFVVITSVTRDDLNDGGASIFAQTIISIRKLNKNCKVEVLIPDFNGNIGALKMIIDANPDVLNHNIETVERLYSKVRKHFSYNRSLELLCKAKKMLKSGSRTKSSIIIGLGESTDEIKKTILDLKGSDCDILTIGQYLSPSKDHYPVQKFYKPSEFEELKAFAENVGFKKVVAAPLARSSYHAASL